MIPLGMDEALGLMLAPEPGTIGITLAVLAVGVLLEGPIVMVVAGSLAGAGLVDWWAVWLVAVLADVVADTVFYVLGRGGRRPRVAGLLVKLGLSASRWAELREKVGGRLPQVVLGAKLVDVGAIPAFLAIGLAGVSYGRFLAWVVPATAVRAALLVGIGWVVGGRFTAELADRPWIIVAVGLGVGLVLVAGRALWVRAATSRKENVCVS
ncbi:DedA family protein [Pseudonocardia parietis]|uniref:Membrane protein DedA with SNARE-associated domain n=1 Tax=Pseudonocardia parietis TaxID=570936 RepID=A0ABS4VQQ3_9PSEU|nr:VTT domain-containing protein [Pseudonocardia parietis]MBP2366244.1 membrane protein DedA with SNARE-associated domain [Pseudonocardia parietis]